MQTDATRHFGGLSRGAREVPAGRRRRGRGTGSHENPAVPDGEGLFTDVALLGRSDGRAMLALCSATHGVEGFAGSALQTGLLADGIGARLDPDTGLVLIHAINPYGFAHLRHANEDNVDLNRNFIDHSKALPANPHYDVAPGSRTRR